MESIFTKGEIIAMDSKQDLKPKPIIVCAAIKSETGAIITGARHFDIIMHKQIDYYRQCTDATYTNWQQGFIDQFGEFYSRSMAMQIVILSGQPFNAERNGGNGFDLYSEGLY